VPQKGIPFEVCRDRQSYVHWLYEARKRFGITILNYFVRKTRQRIGMKVKGRKIVEKGGGFTLREPMSDYGLYSGPENNPIVPENRCFGDVL
jgi:hypothetical protein